MKDHLSADEAAALVGKAGRTLRAKLRQLRDSGEIDRRGAWQDPPKSNGVWMIRRNYLAVLAQQYGWTMNTD